MRNWTHLVRHPIRMIAIGAAVYCAASAITGTTGSIAAVVGAALGVVLGEILARRRFRLWLLAAAALVVAVIGVWLGSASTKYEFVPDAFGPAAALKLSAILRFGIVAFCTITTVRAAARRMQTMAMIELLLVAGAFAIPFAAHRDGVIVRPLWLSDWAWHKGIDPAMILLGIGGVVGGTLALLMMFESERRPSAVSFVALPAIAALAAVLFAVSPKPQKAETSELGTPMEAKGDPPNPTQGSGWPHGGSGQQGSNDESGSNQGSSGGQQQQDQQQGGGKPPPPTEWQDPASGEGKSTPMAIVLLGDDYTPPQQAYYFRMEAWSDFAGARLVAPRRRDVDTDVPRGEPRGTLPSPSPPDTTGMSLMHADVALLVAARKNFYLGEPTLWEPLTNPDPSRFVRVYRFESMVMELGFDQLVGKIGGDPDWTPQVRDYYLTQRQDPRFAQLANEIVSKLPDHVREDPFVRAAAIKQHLDQISTYSLKHRHANVPDPTADFLFGNRIGYCVHMAHAAVYLWRAAGVPARIGVGYMVEADNRRGSSVLIRGGDAHAWPELYLDDIGWVVLDIAPAKNIDPPGTPPDDDLQIQLAELARGAPPDPFAGEVTPVGKRSLVGPAAIVIAAILAAALLALYSIKLWRRLAPRFASPNELPRVGYRAALDILAANGRARELGETREKFAGRLAGNAPSFKRMTDMHLVARLGPPPAAPQSRSEWSDLLRVLRREVATGSSAGRRVLAFINPISFRASR